MNEQNATARKKPGAMIGIIVILIFLVWTPVYLLILRPMINDHLFQYIGSYPAMLHLIPVFAPIFIFAKIADMVANRNQLKNE